MKKQPTTYRFCNEYPEPKVSGLLERASTDIDRTVWESHAAECQLCRQILVADSQLVTNLKRIPTPAPVKVRARVMARIDGRKRPRLVYAGDLLWGGSAAFAGIIIGMLLMSGEVSIPTSSASSGDEMASLTVIDDIDAFVDDLTNSSEE